MPVPSIHKVGHRFDDRNTFLHVALGTIATVHRLRDFFRAYGAPASPGPGGPDGTADEGDARVDGAEVFLPARTQVVQHDDVVAGGHQRIDEVGADEAGSARDQNPHGALSLRRRRERRSPRRRRERRLDPRGLA